MSDMITASALRAYKYMEQQFATALIEHGHIRINTLHNFQEIEKHGTEIGDQDEGVLYTRMGGDKIDPSDPSSLNPSMKRLIDSGALKFEEGASITIMEDLIERTADCYIYSASIVADSSLMHRLAETYDVCVEISDLPTFASIVTAQIRATGRAVNDPVISRVTYASRRAHHTEQTTVHPAFVKDEAYAYQQEIRVLWPTDQPPTEPIDFEVRELRSLVKVVPLDT